MPVRLFLTSAILVTAFSAHAIAHPSPNILQAGAAKGDRVAYTGIQYSEEAGVRMHRGRKILTGGKPAPTPMRSETIEIEIVGASCCCPPARLRTQGFYSGRGHSYPFTQGFYSGYPKKRL